MSDAQPKWLEQALSALDALAAKGTGVTLKFEDLVVTLTPGEPDRKPLNVHLDGGLTIEPRTGKGG
jgi:hypothetical protein